MAFRDTIKDYKRSAVRRLEDAHELMEMPTYDAQRSDAERRHLRGAMYLAGYAVECLLKAYLIQMTNTQTLRAAMKRLNELRVAKGLKVVENIAQTAAGHRISYLVLLTGLETTYADFDPKLWGRTGKWESAWRYENDLVAPEVARKFIADVETAVKWLQPKIGA